MNILYQFVHATQRKNILTGTLPSFYGDVQIVYSTFHANWSLTIRAMQQVRQEIIQGRELLTTNMSDLSRDRIVHLLNALFFGRC